VFNLRGTLSHASSTTAFPITQCRHHPRLSVWAKGRPIANYDAGVWRYDHAGQPIRFADYGDRNSQYGWEIDHIVPIALGGGDHLDNLRPRHWRTNCAAGGMLASALSGRR
jgi:hypothetical protein